MTSQFQGERETVEFLPGDPEKRVKSWEISAKAEKRKLNIALEL